MIRDKTALMPRTTLPLAIAGDTPVAARVFSLLQQQGLRVRRGWQGYDDVAAVVDCTAGIAPAYTVTMAALSRGVPCITANAAMVAVHGRVLANAARGQQCGFYFAAALGPLHPLAGWLASQPVQRITLAMPTAANHILQRMQARGDSITRATQALELAGFDLVDANGKHTHASAMALRAACGLGEAAATRLPLEQLDNATHAALKRFGLAPVYATSLGRDSVWSGVHAVAETSPLLGAFHRQVAVADFTYGQQVISHEMVGDEALAHALAHDATLALNRRGPLATPVCQWQPASASHWLVRAPYTQRAGVLAHAALLDESTTPAGEWQAVLAATTPPAETATCLPLGHSYQPAGGSLRLVG